MDNIALWEGLAWLGGILLTLAGAVNVIGQAVEKITKWRNAAKAPERAQDDRMDTLAADMAAIKEWRKEVDRKLGNDKNQLDEIRNGQCATYKALLALLDHDLNGNNIKQMQDARDALLEHLTDPKGE